jgi:hypothetical protein
MAVIARLDDPLTVRRAARDDADMTGSTTASPDHNRSNRRAVSVATVMRPPARKIARRIRYAEMLAHPPATPRARLRPVDRSPRPIRRHPERHGVVEGLASGAALPFALANCGISPQLRIFLSPNSILRGQLKIELSSHPAYRKHHIACFDALGGMVMMRDVTRAGFGSTDADKRQRRDQEGADHGYLF